ncbi:MAG: DUF2029 domain-containing protein [Chloroflexi bacterium]|nr:DUF2029 domain-containing protein [Chloroflexota bacterium]
MRALSFASELSLDAKIVGALAIGNWLLLFADHTVVQLTRDAPLWQLFPGLWGFAWLLACGLVALLYPLRDHRLGARFTTRDRVLHLAAIVAIFVVIPTIAAIVLRETGKPYTYVHDGAIMVEEAARKLLAGQDPYVADYLDTPLFYWPMINNPALYHLTYFPLLFLVAVPFVAAADALGKGFDIRFLYLPAYLGTLAVAWRLLPAAAPRALALGLVAVVALDPQLFPFVVEGRNDFFVLFFLFAGIALLQRERRTLGVLAICIAASAKLHAGVLLPFVALYLVWRDGARTPREVARTLVPAGWAGALLVAAVFVPFIASDPAAFWDDIVAYNAGGAAWSYPISGMGFSALLLSLGLIGYPQQDFPFWAFQLAAAVPLAVWSLRRLRRDPSIHALLVGYAATLLAFLFFGRYFQGNYLGYVIAVAAPACFIRPPALRVPWRVAGPLVITPAEESAAAGK